MNNDSGNDERETSDKRPQSTLVLVKRLQRVARWMDGYAAVCSNLPAECARANTCWQSAGRLADVAALNAQLLDALKNVVWAASERDRRNRIRQFDEFMGTAQRVIAEADRGRGAGANDRLSPPLVDPKVMELAEYFLENDFDSGFTPDSADGKQRIWDLAWLIQSAIDDYLSEREQTTRKRT